MKSVGLLALILAVFNPACTVTCENAGCGNQATVQISVTSHADGGFASSTYVIAVEGGFDPYEVTCEPAVDAGSYECTDGQMTWSPTDGRVDVAVNISRQPETLTVTVTRDGVVLAKKAIEITYGFVQPSGSQCAPCVTASPSTDRIDV